MKPVLDSVAGLPPPDEAQFVVESQEVEMDRRQFLELGLGASAVGITACQRTVESTAALETPTRTRHAPAPDKHLEVVQQLVNGRAGWDEEAARAVVAFHDGWLTALRANDPGMYQVTLDRLEHLRDAGRLSNILCVRPALAGLFLLADSANVSPKQLGNDIDKSDGNDEVTAGLFLVHSHPQDAASVVDALTRHRDLIAKLYRRGLAGVELLFLFDRTTDDGRILRGIEEYDGWLAAEFGEAASRSDDELADTLSFALAEGPELRRRLRDDEPFRRVFRDVWSRVRRVIDARRGELLRTDLVRLPGLWDFLRLEHAEKLLRAYGPLAVDLLTGAKSYPARVQKVVVDWLLDGDARTVDLLRKGMGWPEMLPFLDAAIPVPLARDLAADVTPRANPTERLRELQGALLKGFDALQQALKPPAREGWVEYLPGYSVYRVCAATASGDQVETEDLLFAAADLATIALPVGRFATTLAKGGAKKVGKEAARTVLREVVENDLRKRVGTAAAKELGQVAVREATVWAACRIAIREGLQAATATGKVVGNRFARGTHVDVTPLVRFLFQQTNVSRKSFKRLTGLEARVFMRSDARVQLVLSMPRADDLSRRAKNWVLDRMVEHGSQLGTLNSEGQPGGEAETRVDSPDRWQEMASTVWMASAVGIFPTVSGMEG